MLCISCGNEITLDPSDLAKHVITEQGILCPGCAEDMGIDDDYEDLDKPVGSCEQCGGSLYEDDDLENELCDQCSWYSKGGDYP